MVEDKRQKRVLFLISAAIIAATLVAYEPMRYNDFVDYDDYKYITENPNVTGGITQQSVIWAFTKFYASNWHPLTWLSHMLDCQLFGLNPLGHHFTNLALHIINALLLLWILANLTGSVWASAFVAAVFALHPLQVESIAWASERKTVLGGLFWLLTTAVYIWYTKKPGIRRYITVFAIFGLSIMAKPVVVTLPLALLLLDYWPLNRLSIADCQLPNEKRRTKIDNRKFFSPLYEKIPLLALSAVSSVITVLAQKSGGAVIELERASLNCRIANVFVSYIRYIGKMIWPSRLALPYPYLYVDFSSDIVIICMLLFALITALAVYVGRRRKYAAMGWLWFVGTLVPMIGLVQVGGQAMADRYMYLTMPGLLIIAAFGAKDIIGKRSRLRIIVSISAIAAISALLILTRMQVGYWQNNLTLFGHAEKVTEDNITAKVNYGAALQKAGRLDEAVPYLTRAIQLWPSFPNTYKTLGHVFLKQGKPGKAVACLNEFLKLNEDTEAHCMLADALGMQKKYDEAIKHLVRALEIDPNDPYAHDRMGMALLATGKPDEAIGHLNEALRAGKNQADLYGNLGAAYTQLGRHDLAIENLNKAIELKPDNVNTLNRLAWILATSGDVPAEDANKAIELARRACEITGNQNPSLLDTLAAAYAAAGKFDDAITTANKALVKAGESDQNELASEIQERVKLYKSGQRYQQKTEGR